MNKMEVKLGNPEIKPDSFAAQPGVMYGAGNRYCRVEESADTAIKIHGLLIISEPDIWMINLFGKNARHFTDPGPTFNCHLPIFSPVGAKDSPDTLVNSLKFGRQFAFFQ